MPIVMYMSVKKREPDIDFEQTDVTPKTKSGNNVYNNVK